MKKLIQLTVFVMIALPSLSQNTSTTATDSTVVFTAYQMREIAEMLRERELCLDHIQVKSDLIIEQRKKLQLIEPQLLQLEAENRALTTQLNEHKERIRNEKRQRIAYVIGGVLVGGLGYAILTN